MSIARLAPALTPCWVGVNYQVTPAIGVRAEYRDLTGSDSSSISSLMVGATYNILIAA